MKVYRVQNKEGRGPYSIRGWEDSNHNDEQHPTPLHDFPLWPYRHRQDIEAPPNIKFGFSSLEQLRKWFSDRELTKLKKYGFDIVEIEAEVLYQSDKQVAFIM